MGKLRSIVVLGMVLALAGCVVRSLHPIYTEKDIVFEPSLIGEWAGDRSKEVFVFSKHGKDGYKLVYTDAPLTTRDKSKQGAFSVQLLKIKGILFLDLYPVKPDLKENLLYKLHLVPVHTFVHVRQIEPTLQMRIPDLDWLNKLLKEDPGAIRHESPPGDAVVLTASTQELQAFWLKHLTTERAFEKWGNLKRRKPSVTGEQPNKPDTGDGK